MHLSRITLHSRFLVQNHSEVIYIIILGLTSPGGKMDDVGVDRVVAIHAEGKMHALAVGLTKMSTADM
jgi:hypothetical protein